MDNELLTRDWGITELQDTLLSILKYLHIFCVDNEIEYCIAYGTVLGAVRHKGFIPWDDDIDIYMTADQFTKFCNAFEQYGDKKQYYIQMQSEKDGMVDYAKLRMNNTTYIEEVLSNKRIHHGIYIDIFILHKVKDKGLSLQKMKLAQKYIEIKKLSNIGYNRRKLYKPILSMLRLMPYDFGRRTALKQLYKYDGLNAEYYFENGYNARVQYYDKEILFPYSLIEFCGTEVFAPSNPQKYLEIMYGDYQRIPSYDEIKWGIHAQIWDSKKDYSFYLHNDNDFSDEKML